MKKNAKKKFIIHGERIKSIESFYDEIENITLTGGVKFGRNLDAFVDILRGGFGTFEYGEEIIVEWKNFHQGGKFPQKKDILEILEEAENVEFLKY